MRRLESALRILVWMNFRKGGPFGGPGSVRAGRYRVEFEYRVSVKARRGPDGAGPSRKAANQSRFMRSLSKDQLPLGLDIEKSL